MPSAETIVINDFEISVDGEHSYITKYLGKATTVTIPPIPWSVSNEITVIGLDSKCFCNCPSINTIYINLPEQLSEIESQLDYDITVPEHEDDVFNNCPNLGTIIINQEETKPSNIIYGNSINQFQFIQGITLNMPIATLFKECNKIKYIYLLDHILDEEENTWELNLYSKINNNSIELPNDLNCNDLVFSYYIKLEERYEEQPTYYSGTFYKKVSNVYPYAYEELTSEPSDWEINWKDYYKRLTLYDWKVLNTTSPT